MESWPDMSDDELLEAVGKGIGGEPAVRWLGLVESNRRVVAAVNELRAETARSSRTMEKLTWALVVMTAVLVLAGIATVWAAIQAT